MNAATATAPYPAASLRPSASPRRRGPARAIFMMTVVDQAKPWLIPRNTLAATTIAQLGAQIIMGATGRAATHPRARNGFRPYRAEECPAGGVVAAVAGTVAAGNGRV